MAIVPFGTPADPINVLSQGGAAGVLDTSNVQIDPATEQTALAILAALGGTVGLKWYLYGEALAVPMGTPTIVVTYTVPAGKKLTLALVQAACQNRAEFVVAINAATVAKRYTQVTILTTDFSFGSGLAQGIEVTAGKKVDVTITHNQPTVGDMSATLIGELETV